MGLDVLSHSTVHGVQRDCVQRQLHCKKILFSTALRRIFAALVKEKPCLSAGAFFSRTDSAFLLSYRSEKVPALTMVFSPL